MTLKLPYRLVSRNQRQLPIALRRGLSADRGVSMRVNVGLSAVGGGSDAGWSARVALRSCRTGSVHASAAATPICLVRRLRPRTGRPSSHARPRARSRAAETAERAPARRPRRAVSGSPPVQPSVPPRPVASAHAGAGRAIAGVRVATVRVRSASARRHALPRRRSRSPSPSRAGPAAGSCSPRPQPAPAARPPAPGAPAGPAAAPTTARRPSRPPRVSRPPAPHGQRAGVHADSAECRRARRHPTHGGDRTAADCVGRRRSTGTDHGQRRQPAGPRRCDDGTDDETGPDDHSDAATAWIRPTARLMPAAHGPARRRTMQPPCRRCRFRRTADRRRKRRRCSGLAARARRRAARGAGRVAGAAAVCRDGSGESAHAARVRAAGSALVASAQTRRACACAIGSAIGR